MEHNSGFVQLVGSEIHGFWSMADLDVRSILEEATARWLRPNEIHAILCNHKFFTINVKPVTLPKSGTILLFDRKKFRNFRKDGYSWKKKKDGKTIKEAHEHLKVGNEERIHVYYAHGENNPTFVRRCYWLLEKSLDHIVLVHYRETQEIQPQGSPATPVNSYTNSGVSDLGSWDVSEEPDPAEVQGYGAIMSALDHSERIILEDHEQRLREINTLEWDELLGPDVPQRPSSPQEGKPAGTELQNVHQTAGISEILQGCPLKRGSITPGPLSSGKVEGLSAQDNFGRWISNLMDDPPHPVHDRSPEPSNEPLNYPSPVQNHEISMLGQIFKILDISPGWASANEESKILVVVNVEEGHHPDPALNLYLACGNCISPVEYVAAGVYRCLLSPQSPGSKKLYLTVDGKRPTSQVLNFEFRSSVLSDAPASLEDEVDWAEYQLQMRLARLLFSSSTALSTYSHKTSETSLKEARAFYRSTSNISDSWLHLGRMSQDARMSFSQAKSKLFELILQSRLREWLLEKVVSGDKVSEHDEKGLGVIHLCTILDYAWAVHPFSMSGLSLDFRDKFGWTALHWAASYGKVKMVAALLSAGAKPHLVTDPTSENPSGYTASDLASRNGCHGLAGYLAEKALVAQFNDITIAGNASDLILTPASSVIYAGNLTEEELNMKETLAAYRNAADAASRIHSAFRMRSLKLRTKQAEAQHPELEARNIVAALKIQHAFKNYEARKKIAAANRIQHRFRTWKMRKDFLNMRRQAIKIQAHFRGYQVRKQYRKLVWSVGVIEKAILRWSQKRKGFRGLQVQLDETMGDSNPTSDVEEDFFKASRREAEDRIERSVTRVQAMMHSKQAQEEYRRVKREHTRATMECQEPQPPDYEIV